MSALPQCGMDEFRSASLQAVNQEQCRVSAFFALGNNCPQNTQKGECTKEVEKSLLVEILLDPQQKCLRVLSTEVCEKYPSLTAEAPAFHWFERELFEETGILPEGHPWLKPIRFADKNREPGVTDYFTMEGEAVHEVAVGPVHAGVIEPGHFRFQCMGEDVFSLEIELGYQHRGIEKMLVGGPDVRTTHILETAAGDTSVAAMLNYCGILEALCQIEVPARGVALRRIALELERIANHIGDLGALAGDVAFLPTSSFCGRIRGDFLNMTARLCGNRFGRGLVVPGGVRYELDKAGAEELLKKVQVGEKELQEALSLMFDEPTVLDRFENTGVVSTETARQIGLVGVAGRASGLAVDCRGDLSENGFVPAVEQGGDVLSRALVRRRELEASLAEVKGLLESLRGGESRSTAVLPTALPNDTLCVHLTEAWRGEICHVAITDGQGRFRRVKIVDPSFHNWFGLAMALRNQQISDFPICNKSFNLSYCGHDL